MAKYCARCGTPAEDSAGFCSKCGSAFPAATTTPPPTVAPVAPSPAPPPTYPAPPPQYSAPYQPQPQYAPPMQTTVVVQQGASHATIFYIVGFVWLILAVIAAVVAAGLSSDGAYDWAAGVYLGAAMGFGFAGVFFWLGQRASARARMMPMAPPVAYSPPPPPR